MTTQLLFYQNVTPVMLEKHRDLCVEGTNSYEFARSVNSVPLTAVEMPHAAHDYTIVFAGTDDTVIPVVILGVEGNENVYINDDGGWDARYIPAFVRRYPFVFSKSEDGSTFTLCVDDNWSGCNSEGRGQRLFNEKDEHAPYLDKILNFLQDYQVQFVKTQTYCKKLKELDLLEPMQAQVTFAAGEQRSLVGFMAVSRDKLKALSGEQLSELAKIEALELTYIHLQSMNNFTLMAERAAKRRGLGTATSNSDQASKPGGNGEIPKQTSTKKKGKAANV